MATKDEPRTMRLPAGKARTRLPSLTALRIIPAVLVFISHGMVHPLFTDNDINESYLFITRNMGVIALSLFFILSGFILTWSSEPTDTARLFWRRRFFRIFPNHLVVCAIILVMMLLAGREIMGTEVLVSLPLLQSWLPDPNFLLYSANGPTWSLSVEMLFYAAFPLLFFLVKKIRVNRLWLWAGIMAVGALLMPVIARVFLPDEPMSFFSDGGVSWPQQWFSFYFPPARMFEFGAGMIMARILQTGRWPAIRPIVPLLMLVVVFLATLPFDMIAGFQAVALIPVSLLITSMAANDLAGKENFFNRKTMVWLGDLSYPFFLVHVTVFFSLHAAFSGQWGVGGMYEAKQFSTLGGIAVLVGGFLLCLFVSWLLFVLVERPIMRRWSRPRRKAAEPPLASVRS